MTSFGHIEPETSSARMIVVRANGTSRIMCGRAAAVASATRPRSRSATGRCRVQRLRLGSTVINDKHIGDPATAKEIELTYAKADRGYKVRARGVVMAGFNAMVPYLCPEMPSGQKDALHMAAARDR